MYGTLQRLGLVLCLLLVVAFTVPSSASELALADALKKMDKATSGLHGLTGKATAIDLVGGEENYHAAGAVSISTQGKLRIDLTGDHARTILCLPGKMYVHEPRKSLATEYPLKKHPGKLAQYALVGFSPSGQEMNKDYILTVLEEGSLDDHKVLMLELTPKSDEVRRIVSKIHLWIDELNWLPVQQRIFHSAAETHLTIRYSDLVRDDQMSSSVFRPKWPEGTRKLKVR